MWLGYHGFPDEIGSMMSSTWLSIYAKCYILDWLGVGRVRMFYWLTKRGIGGQNHCCKPIVSLRTYYSMGSSPNSASKIWQVVKEHTLTWDIICIFLPSWKPSNESFSSRLPKILRHMWKLEHLSLEWMGFEYTTCKSDYYFFP